MNVNEMNNKVHELRELRRMAEELDGMIQAIQDDIKDTMTAQGKDTLTGPDWKITWKSSTASRLDTTALKKALPDIAAQFMRTSTSRRFVLA